MFQGGIHLFYLVDNFGPSGTNLLLIAIAETIVVAWVYGKWLAVSIDASFYSLQAAAN